MGLHIHPQDSILVLMRVSLGFGGTLGEHLQGAVTQINVQVVTEASSQIRGSEARARCWLLSLGSSHCLTLHVSPWFSFLQDTEDFDFRLG